MNQPKQCVFGSKKISNRAKEKHNWKDTVVFSPKLLFALKGYQVPCEILIMNYPDKNN